MVVGRIGDGQVLRLAEDVIALKGESHLLIKQLLLYLEIKHVLGRLSGSVTVIPVIVELTLRTKSYKIPTPSSGSANLIVERGRAILHFLDDIAA